MKDSLVLTLGHGSSAILIKDNKIVNGYMNERISKLKSDSQFPMEAIEELMKWDDITDNVTIYVSHWEPTADIDRMSERHWNPTYINRRFPNHTLKSLNIDFTHHKAHAYSALAYFNDEVPDDCHIITADGFGNYGEVFTIYKIINGVPEPVHSVHNYEASLGLLYQYATDYVGLKMNQDEWKLNAAASRVYPSEIDSLITIADSLSSEYISRLTIPINEESDPIFSLSALSYVHKSVIDMLSKHFEPREKAQIAFVLQRIVEKCIKHFIFKYDIKNVLLVGGVFMNVQLNGSIAKAIQNKVGVMPLSGDSGAGLGVYKYHNKDFIIPDNLCWGKRNLLGILSNKLHYVQDLNESLQFYLGNDFIVNVIRDKMEFGERAYCNTSTIALPYLGNCKAINKANGRDTDMPMAPVMTERTYEFTFTHTYKVIKSVKHMIMSLPYKETRRQIDGVKHYLPFEDYFTGRPQVLNEDHPVYPSVNKFGPLINTSFNIHGQPICLTASDIKKAHEYQQKHDTTNRFVTLIEVKK